MQGPGHVTHQEAYGDDVEEDSQRAGNSIVGLTARANDVFNRHFDDLGPVPRGECRNEPVHFSVQRNVFYYLAAINLEGGAEIVDVHTGELAHHPVSGSRWQAAEEEIVHTFFAPAADDIGIGGFQSCEQGRYISGIVLEITVHGNDDVARGKIEARCEGGS